MSTITSIQTYVSGNICIVEVATDDGQVGYGQTAPSEPGITAEVLHRLVAKHMLGGDPWDIGALVERAIRAEYKYLGAFLLRAVSGVDTALWDLKGRATGQPVYRLLGGKVREKVPVYASSMSRETGVQEELRRIGEAVEAHGFPGAKVKIGVRNGRDAELWTGRTAALVPAMRATFGDAFLLNADANGAYSPGGAVVVGRRLEEYGYYHLEEPNPSWELDNMGYVADHLDLPIGAGEQEFSMEIVRRMVAERLVDVIQPDVCYIGGMERARKVAEMADIAGIPCTPHCSNRSLIQVFTAHLVLASPACVQHQEWTIEKPSAQPFYAPVPVVKDGYIEVSDAPGWGVEILPSFLESAERRSSALS
ncbi:mandelate racemase/muconate lactonizing enzyme family protein [Streptomyces sp. SBT349]|uniref:mandelate racemase/muconate lactonizing enzyme family protein n=1 Tax=Streptomyces sp. SBT349 TaxID=1580539 RepID=UPI0007C66EBD|nr:mandelate racemase/muconate lactonizing enzyme family protein [Streptomyces sp. SBT349]